MWIVSGRLLIGKGNLQLENLGYHEEGDQTNDENQLTKAFVQEEIVIRFATEPPQPKPLES